MRGAVLAGSVMIALGGAAWAQQWIPPLPGQPLCSGWSTPKARDACQAKEDRAAATADAARDARAARTKALLDAEGARLDAARQAAEAAKQKAAADSAAQQAADDDRARTNAAVLSARARAWDFDADKFGGYVAAISIPRGDYVRPVRPSCSQPDGDVGICTYAFDAGPEMEVMTRPGSFRAARVTLRWDGDRRGIASFYRLMMVVGYALAPEADAGTAINRAGGALGVLNSPDPWPERRWTLGRTDYALRSDAQLGARQAATFTARDAVP